MCESVVSHTTCTGDVTDAEVLGGGAQIVTEGFEGLAGQEAAIARQEKNKVESRINSRNFIDDMARHAPAVSAKTNFRCPGILLIS